MQINQLFLISYLELFPFHSLILIPGFASSSKKKKQMNWQRFLRMKETIRVLRKENSFSEKFLFSVLSRQILTALPIVIIFYLVFFREVRFLKNGSGKIYLTRDPLNHYWMKQMGSLIKLNTVYTMNMIKVSNFSACQYFSKAFMTHLATR